jgi:hypothetical protein
MNKTTIKWTAWILSGLVLVAAIVAWGQSLDWQISGITAYQWFPLLGLTAFSLMWGHYIVGALRRYFGVEKAVLSQYFEVTSMVVLFAILLHPGILWLQLWRDGFGLPPKSYLTVYGVGSMKLAVVLGSISLAVFLMFELRRKYGEASWWKYVSYSSDVAMLAIFYHGLTLGGQLQGGWYRALWFAYGITLVLAIGYIRFGKRWQKVGDG